MCGRFTLKNSRAKITQLIGSLKALPLFEPRYNIAASQPVLAVRIEPERGEHEGTMLKLVLIPVWAIEPSIGNNLINAQADTVAVGPRHSVRAGSAALRNAPCLGTRPPTPDLARFGPTHAWHKLKRKPII
jgi:putative SOS response-associated peptidase YedK